MAYGGKDFTDLIEKIAKSFKMFDQSNSNYLFEKSLGIVITKVDNEDDSDEQVKESLKLMMKGYLKKSLKTKTLPKNAAKLLEPVLLNDHFEIFSNPGKPVILDDLQNKKIKAMIDNLVFIGKSQVKMVPKLDKDDINPRNY